MGTANRTNITKRSDKSTALTHPELDQNFDELGNVIDDQVNHELATDPHSQYGYVFNSVADMETATFVEVGQFVRTLGYYTPGDGGGNDYEIVAGATGTADGGSFIDLDNGLQTKGLFVNGYFLEQFGGRGDDSADNTNKWNSVNDFIENLGGGFLNIGSGRFLLGKTTIGDKVFVKGAGLDRTVLVASPSMQESGTWIESRNPGTGQERPNNATGIADCTLDGSLRPFSRWLSTLAGTPVTDPQADYVMGTGALASGVSGVDLTATVSGGAVTGVTVNSGGAGFNGHPTNPYQPNTVPIWFSGGGGHGAQAFGTISAGAIVSVTVERGGYGYTTAPTVVSAGGYADISLLTDPGVDRRNPLYDTTGGGVAFRKCDSPRVERVKFYRIRGRALSDAGCLNARFNDLEFNECGKDDGAFGAIWAQSLGTPGGGDSFYAPTENITISNTVARNCERSAVLFAPPKGGTIDNLVADGCGESAIFIPDAMNSEGGVSVIKNCIFRNGVLTDIASNYIEAGNAKRLNVQDNYFERGSLQPVVATGNVNSTYHNNTFKDCYTTATSQVDGKIPFGPFSERYAFGAGSRPIANNHIAVEDGAYISVGSIGPTGSDNLKVVSNTFLETRAVYPASVIKQSKSGTDKASKYTLIEGNSFQGQAGQVFYDNSISSVFEDTMPLFIRRNHNTASFSPKTFNITHAAGETGAFPIDCGFRPSRVDVYASDNNASEGTGFYGSFSWSDQASPWAVFNGWNVHLSGRSQVVPGLIAEMRDEISNVVFRAALVNWDELGFSYNISVSTGGIKRLQFQCFP